MVSCHQSFGPARIHPSSDGANLAWRTSRVGVRRAGAAPKMAMCQTIDRRMTEPMSVCRGSVSHQNAHEDCTTHHVSRKTARRPPDHDSVLRGRVCYEKWPSWLAGGLVDDRDAHSTQRRRPNSHGAVGMCIGGFQSMSAGFHPPPCVYLADPCGAHSWRRSLTEPGGPIGSGVTSICIYVCEWGVK